MQFQYNPADAQQCWPEGEYPAVIESTEVTTSKSSGQPMLAVTLKAFRRDQQQLISDYIVKATTYKLREIAIALDGGEKGKNYDQFKAGEFDLDQHTGKNIKLKLIVEENAEYGDRNKVKKYLAKSNGQPSPEPEDDPDVPF